MLFIQPVQFRSLTLSENGEFNAEFIYNFLFDMLFPGCSEVRQLTGKT